MVNGCLGNHLAHASYQNNPRDPHAEQLMPSLPEVSGVVISLFVN